jgi:ABC-type phosphate transport system permease subunit
MRIMLTDLLPSVLAGTVLTLSSPVPEVAPPLLVACVESATSLHGKAAASATATVHACQEQVRRRLHHVPQTARSALVEPVAAAGIDVAGRVCSMSE